MKIRLWLLISVLFTLAAHAEPDADIQSYIGIIREHIYKDYPGMFKPAKGALKYPFITPGSSQYENQLWDWDSWLADVALRQILLENGTPQEREEALKHEQGCVLNFLELGGWQGWLPVRVTPKTSRAESIMGDTNLFANNMHKPCLAQHAAFLTKLNGGDAGWLREKFYPLQAFVNCYYNHYRHKATGLYYWQTDETIGVDNDPSTFNAPYGVRTLSAKEKMYDVRATGNPSCWLGPVWINANYLTFRGLVKYGFKDDARALAEKTIRLLGRDYETNGALHEYYLPESGEPVLNKGFQNWNYLVLNMIAWYEGKPYVEEF